MKGYKSTSLNLAEKCKNILASNWQGHLNTIKADSKGSKQEIYSSKVKYLLRKGKPYIWVPEKDLHNVNTIIDERASFAVPRPYPVPLANLLRSIKMVRSASESLREMVMSEQKKIIESSYAVSGILSSSTFGNTSRSENLMELLDNEQSYVVYRFNASCWRSNFKNQTKNSNQASPQVPFPTPNCHFVEHLKHDIKETKTTTFMKGYKSTSLILAEKCKNILASNWQGHLNTIKADSKGSKQEIYSSKVKYLLWKGKPYIWVPEKDLHNVNTIIDERASFAVPRPYPRPLANLLRSIKMLPIRIALTGEIVALRDEKVRSASESLREMVMSEQKKIIESSYAVSGILSSSTFGNTSRSENLMELLDNEQSYVVYRFNASSCMFIDENGGNHEVDPDGFEKLKADKLSPFTAKLVDGINQSETRRRALVVLCGAFLNVNAKDTYILSVDRKGFDVLARVFSSGDEYRWKEVRFAFEKEAEDVELFCNQLAKMEEAALDKVKSCSGLG